MLGPVRSAAGGVGTPPQQQRSAAGGVRPPPPSSRDGLRSAGGVASSVGPPQNVLAEKTLFCPCNTGPATTSFFSRLWFTVRVVCGCQYQRLQHPWNLLERSCLLKLLPRSADQPPSPAGCGSAHRKAKGAAEAAVQPRHTCE